jgi:hypothetical protein
VGFHAKINKKLYMVDASGTNSKVKAQVDVAKE